MSAPIEPSAALRQLASVLRQTYVALVAEGFTMSEAIEIISAMLRSANEGRS